MTTIIQQGRRSGKTTAAVEWVKEGKKTKAYPGWTRILLTIDQSEADRLRCGPDSVLDYHQVFTFDEWKGRGRGSGRNVEIAIDNLDIILAQVLGRTVQFFTWGDMA